MIPRRNLLIVLTHGLRSDALGDSETWPLQTPNLQTLGERSLRLVATSACPADPGAMMSLVTGQHPRQHGRLAQCNDAAIPWARDPLAAEGFPDWLKAEGYHVTGVGCVGQFSRAMHEPVVVAQVDDASPQGCAYTVASASRGMAAAVAQQRKQRQRGGWFDPDRLLLEPDDDIDGFIAAEASKKLRSMPTDKPWALVVAFSGPGNELPPPPMYADVVDPGETSVMSSLVDFTNVDAVAELDYPRAVLQRMQPHKLGRVRADYLGRVSLIDFAVGRLQREMEDRLDAPRTWVMLTSDRGCLLGEHGLVGHRSFLCGAVEVPVLLKPPTPPPRFVPEGLVSTADIAPTIAELGGADRPDHLSGRSLLAMLRQDDPSSPSPGRALLSEFGHRLLLETERYKLVLRSDNRRPLCLFDLLTDPDERHNLIDRDDARAMLPKLMSRLAEELLPVRGPRG